MMPTGYAHVQDAQNILTYYLTFQTLLMVSSIEDTVSKFIGIGERLIQLPANERQYYREAVSQTYRVLDNA